MGLSSILEHYSCWLPWGKEGGGALARLSDSQYSLLFKEGRGMLLGEHFITEMQMGFLFYFSYTIIRKRIHQNSSLNETSNMIPPLESHSVSGRNVRGKGFPTRGCQDADLP